jgi:hypothetical protein
MTPIEPGFAFSAAVVVLLTVLIFVSYARLLPCNWCRSPFGVHSRAAGDLCRSCATVFDKHRAKIGYKRTLLQRIRRAAA